jgi:hypothetical protein
MFFPCTNCHRRIQNCLIVTAIILEAEPRYNISAVFFYVLQKYCFIGSCILFDILPHKISVSYNNTLMVINSLTPTSEICTKASDDIMIVPSFMKENRLEAYRED